MQKTTIATTQEVQISPRLQKQLLTELHAYASISSEVKALEEAKKEHSGNILQLSTEVDAERYTVEGYKVAVVKGAKDRRLDKDRLIRRLIGDGKYSMKAALALLEDCTTETEKRPHVRITVGGDDEREPR